MPAKISTASTAPSTPIIAKPANLDSKPRRATANPVMTPTAPTATNPKTIAQPASRAIVQMEAVVNPVKLHIAHVAPYLPPTAFNAKKDIN